MNCKDCRVEITKDNTCWINNKYGKFICKVCKKCLSKKQSDSSKGNIPWNKNKKMPEGFPEKISKITKGREPWNKNKKMPEGFPEKISKISKNNWKNKEYRDKVSKTTAKSIKDKWKDKEYRNKQLISSQADKTRQKQRIKMIDYIEKTKLNGKILRPNIGRYETGTLDILEEYFGYKIERQYRVNGYFLDGYCRILNLAIEIDESFHKDRIKEDRYREEQIKNELHCQFLRIEVPS